MKTPPTLRSSAWRVCAASALGAILGSSAIAAEPSTITFSSEDDLDVTADVYAPSGMDNRPVIVLFHQARYSRGEYRDTAPRLNALGFACIAVDQRSGGKINGVDNETAKRAEEQGFATEFEDALPDMRAALAYARDANGGAPVIGLGSSYSSALVLTIAANRPGLLDGTLSFSPGEYFGDRNLIKSAAAGVTLPVFITSARSERNAWNAIFDAVASEEKTGFVPASAGRHGSSTLWPTTAENAETWAAVEAFLAQWLPPSDSTPEATVAFDATTGEVTTTFTSAPETLMVIESTREFAKWIAVTSVQNTATLTFPQSQGEVFMRARIAEATGAADVTAAQASGAAGGYTFNVTISSPDTGCEQYADWWEVLNEEGEVLYRRVLLHSHVSEQPFTRSGGSVAIDAATKVWIRAHMNHSGYGGKAMTGTVSTGFQESDLPQDFAPWAATTSPLPNGCNF